MGASRGGPCSVSTVCCVDLGLVKRWRLGGSRAESASACRHIDYREGKALMGTARYASIHSHLGLELSRRDDLESIAYVLVYLANGRLPWQGADLGDQKHNLDDKNKNKYKKYERYQRIGLVKRATSSVQLCSRLPQQLALFLDVVRTLDFAEEPPYALLFVCLISSLLFLHFNSNLLHSIRDYLCAQDLLLSAYSAQFGGHITRVVPAAGADVAPAGEQRKKKTHQRRRQAIESYVAPDWRYDWVLYLQNDEQFQDIQQQARKLLALEQQKGQQQPMTVGQSRGELLRN